MTKYWDQADTMLGLGPQELTEPVSFYHFLIFSIAISLGRLGPELSLQLLSSGFAVLSLLGVLKTECNILSITPDGPAIVRVNLFVRSIATISDIKMVS